MTCSEAVRPCRIVQCLPPCYGEHAPQLSHLSETGADVVTAHCSDRLQGSRHSVGHGLGRIRISQTIHVQQCEVCCRKARPSRSYTFGDCVVFGRGSPSSPMRPSHTPRACLQASLSLPPRAVHLVARLGATSRRSRPSLLEGKTTPNHTWIFTARGVEASQVSAIDP